VRDEKLRLGNDFVWGIETYVDEAGQVVVTDKNGDITVI